MKLTTRQEKFIEEYNGQEDKAKCVYKIIERLGSAGFISIDSDNKIDMTNADKMRQFINLQRSGKHAEICVIRIFYSDVINILSITADKGQAHISQTYYTFQDDHLINKGESEYAAEFFEYTDEVARVSKSGLLTDKCEIVISKQKILFSLENTHLLNIFLTGHSIEVMELGCKARIAHITFLGYTGYADVLFKVLIDIFGDIFYSIVIRWVYRTIVNIKSFTDPIPDNCEKQSVDIRPEHSISAVLVFIKFINARIENLFAVETLRFFTAKVHFHIL